LGTLEILEIGRDHVLALCIDQLLSVVTEDALLLVNTGNFGIIESKRIQVRSSELDQRNAS
jgi:hypothetical protein